MIMGSSLQVIGRVVKRKLGKGSQPDRLVNAIQTDEGLSIIVRRENTTAFSDEQFEVLEGKEVQITGVMQGFVLVVSNTQVIEKKIETNNSAFVDEIKAG